MILLARLGQQAFYARSLPMNQWQNEVIYWVGAPMSGLGALFVKTAMGTMGGLLLQYPVSLKGAEEHCICINQVCILLMLHFDLVLLLVVADTVPSGL